MVTATAMVAAAAAWPGPGQAADDPIAVDAGQEASLLRTMGSGFTLKRTPHFLVAYQAESEILAELTNRLEHTYHAIYRFLGVLGVEARRPDQRLEVLLFEQRIGYDLYAARVGFPSAGTYGAYFEAPNRAAFFNATNEPTLLALRASIMAARANLDALTAAMESIRDKHTPVQVRFQDGREVTLTRSEVDKEVASARDSLDSLDAKRQDYSDRINRTVIQHEIAHQVFFNAGVHVPGADNPRWLVEGLACLFETPPGETGAGFAAVNQIRLNDLRSAVAGGSDKRVLRGADFAAAVAAGWLPSPQRLVSAPSLFYERGEAGAANYALTWALTYYLHKTRKTQFVSYLQAVRARRPGGVVTAEAERALFREHFGPVDEDFLKRWGTYILDLPARSPWGPK